MAENILRLPEVEKRTGLSEATIKREVKRKTFPAPVKLSARAIGWHESSIDEFIASRPQAGQLVPAQA